MSNQNDRVPLPVSLRDWFAGMALSGMLANRYGEYWSADYARDAYEYADALLAEREKQAAEPVDLNDPRR